MTNLVYGEPRGTSRGAQKVPVRTASRERLEIRCVRATVARVDDRCLQIFPREGALFESVQSDVESAAFLNRLEWFQGKSVTLEHIRHIARRDFDSGSGSLTLRCPIKPKVFDQNRTETKRYEDLRPGDVIDVIVRLVGVYFIRGAFGATWSVKQIKVYEPPLHAYAFVSETESSESDFDLWE